MRQHGDYHFKAMFWARVVLVALVGLGLAAFVGGLAVFGWAALLGLQGRDDTAVATAWLLIGAACMAFGAAGCVLPRCGVLFEYRVRLRFRAVCEHKGLVSKDAQGRPVYPRYGRLVGRPTAFRLRVAPLLGHSVADWERATPALALAYGVAGVRVRDNLDGTLLLSVGYQQIDQHEFQLSSSMPPVRKLSWREQLATVVIGRREGNQPYALPLIDSHILIAGITGAGKGSAVWSLALGLMPAFRAGVVRFWGFDPKLMELSIGRNLFGQYYAAEPEAMIELLERAHDEMQSRAARLAGHVRKFEPSVEHPLHVLLVDELGYLSALLPDRKLRDRAERALSGILVLGRAAGFVVVGALQDPRKETLGYRDLFPTRIAMRLSKPMVDLVLGHGMYEAGAQCDLIPAGQAGAGVAFVVDEASTLPVCVRMSWCPDDLIKSMAGELPASSEAATRRLRAV